MLEQLKIQLIGHRRASDALLEEICRLKAQHWAYSVPDQLQWIRTNLADGDYHLILRGQDDALIAYLDMVELEACIDQEKVDLIGIGNVCVDAKFQKHKLGNLLMDANQFYLRQLDKAGVLMCKEKLVGFYTKAKWQRFKNTVILMGSPYTEHLFFSSDRFEHAKEVHLSKNF
jgi:predicted GNAT family N-acyltransferase